jgi:hypothetical protein
VYKILTGKDNVNSEHWFTMAAGAPGKMRQAAGLTNTVKPISSLDLWANFFPVRIVDK